MQDVESLTLSAAQAAKALGICRTTLHKLTAAGEVPHLRIGRRLLYRPEALRKFLAEQEQQSHKVNAEDEDNGPARA